MGFPGTGHHGGIKDEADFRDELENHPDMVYCMAQHHYGPGKYLDYTVEPQGGTKQKTDNLVRFSSGLVLRISNKYNKKGPSFWTWVNTTEPINNLIRQGHDCTLLIREVNLDIKEIRNIPDEFRMKQYGKGTSGWKGMDKSIKAAASHAIDNLDLEYLYELIERILIVPNENMYMVLSCGDERYGRMGFSFSEYPVAKLLKDGFGIKLRHKSGAASARIIFWKEGEEDRDVGLVIRIHENCGTSAALGVGKTLNSCFCMKIEQTNVKKILKEIEYVKL